MGDEESQSCTVHGFCKAAWCQSEHAGSWPPASGQEEFRASFFRNVQGVTSFHCLLQRVPRSDVDCYLVNRKYQKKEYSSKKASFWLWSMNTYVFSKHVPFLRFELGFQTPV